MKSIVIMYKNECLDRIHPKEMWGSRNKEVRKVATMQLNDDTLSSMSTITFAIG